MTRFSVIQWQQALLNKETQSSDITRYYQERIQKREPHVKGFLKIFESPIQSHHSDLSIPIAIKDNICLKNQLTTCGSKILANFIPPYDAFVSQKLLTAGLPIIGKANMDEFAMGSSNENSAFQITHNPWNLDCVPGGSSGGSAALVAAEMVPWSLGSDTGGSVRLPASFCGVVGMKPTYGMVSRYGLVAYASSLDQIGPITATVHDNALLLSVIAGHDKQDSTSLQTPSPAFASLLNTPIQGLKLAIPKEMLGEGIDPEVRQAFETALAVYESLGAQVTEISMPTLPYSLAAYYLIATCEASSNLARYDGVRYGYRSPEAKNLKEMFEKTRTEGFGDEVKLRIMLGTFALSSGYYDAYYKKAMQVRDVLRQEFAKVFTQYDAILSPTAPMTAFKIGEKTDDPLQMYLSDIMTVSANLVGVPALSIPCGFDSAGMPIGLQLMGQALSEAKLYQLGHAYEQANTWYERRPKIVQEMT